MDLLNMEKVEAPKIDVSKYVGQFVEIENVEVIETQFGNAIKVSSKPLEVIEITGKDDIVIRATRIFSVTKEGQVVIDSKLDKFMDKQKVEQPLMLIGTKIQVLKNDKDFLTF